MTVTCATDAAILEISHSIAANNSNFNMPWTNFEFLDLINLYFRHLQGLVWFLLWLTVHVISAFHIIHMLCIITPKSDGASPRIILIICSLLRNKYKQKISIHPTDLVEGQCWINKDWYRPPWPSIGQVPPCLFPSNHSVPDRCIFNVWKHWLVFTRLVSTGTIHLLG